MKSKNYTNSGLGKQFLFLLWIIEIFVFQTNGQYKKSIPFYELKQIQKL